MHPPPSPTLFPYTTLFRSPKDELLTRLVRRNAALPQGTFYIAPEQIERWAERFEPPSADELERTPRHGHAVIVLTGDRKSTRLNSSHMSISYAVFCLKKKT